MLKIYQSKQKILELNLNGKHVLFDSKSNRFIVANRMENLDELVAEKKYLHAVLLDQPIRPFVDIDINTDDVSSILPDLDTNEKKAEYIKQTIIDEINFQLELLCVPDDYLAYAVAIDHRADKYSFACYWRYCSFQSLKHLKHFWQTVEQSLPDNIKQFFDKPSSNFRLVGAYKNDHVRRWVDDFVDIEASIPNYIDPANNYEIELQLNETKPINLTDQDMDAALKIAEKCDYINDNFSFQSTKGNTLNFIRLSSAHCDLCDREHDSIGAYVVLKEKTVYRGCYKNTEVVKIGELDSTPNIPQNILDEMADMEPTTPEIILPAPKPEQKSKLKYCNDAAYLIGANWKAEDVDAWVKRCIFKVTMNSDSKWLTLDYSVKEDIEVMKVSKDIPFWQIGDRRKIQVDSKEYNLASYIIDFCNKPDNFYTDFVNYPYLREKDDKYQNKKIINMWLGYQFKFEEIKRPVIKDSFRHWIDHFKLIDNGNIILLKWIAHAIQRPYEKAHNVQLMGAKGTGKSIIFSAIERIFGSRSTLQVSDLNSVTGNFNSSLENRILINLNECCNFTKARERNIFKSLTTETNLRINRKFEVPYSTKFYGRFLITTNEKFGIDVSPDDRRNYCVETPSAHKGNEAYFKPLIDDLNGEDNTPFQDLFNYLANIDISSFKPMQPPMTKFKMELIKTSVDPIYHYLYEFANGERKDISEEDDEKTKISIVHHKVLYDDYRGFMNDEGEPACLIKKKKQFAQILESLGLQFKRPRVNGIRFRGYEIDKTVLKNNLSKYITDNEMRVL